MLTEDIDITWKLQRAGWKVNFEPHALVWILMPETLRGLWKQRLRWATGGAQVLARNFGVLAHPGQSHMWPLLAEMCASVIWSYLMLLLVLLWLAALVLPAGLLPAGLLPIVSSPFLPHGSGLILGVACLMQFALSQWLDSRYERGLGRYYYWIIWYPLVFWLINTAATVAAYPQMLGRRSAKRARWVSPDRGLR
jgi:biofilm PGA synthesis N-glycosyltransferase PgaC